MSEVWFEVTLHFLKESFVFPPACLKLYLHVVCPSCLDCVLTCSDGPTRLTTQFLVFLLAVVHLAGVASEVFSALL